MLMSIVLPGALAETACKTGAELYKEGIGEYRYKAGEVKKYDEEITLTPKGRYLMVVMMRQFFIGVNNLRDQARAALPGEEKELLFGC